MTSFALKLIAMTTMVIDHTGDVFFGNNLIMRTIGRAAFLTYAFLMAESYYHLRDRPERLRVHVIKILLLAIITEFFFDQYREGVWLEFGNQNALFTLLAGFAALIGCGAWKRKYGDDPGTCGIGRLLIVMTASTISYFIRAEYAVAGIVFIVLSYLYLCRADAWSVPKRMAALFGVLAVYAFFLSWTYAGFGGWEAIGGFVKKYPYWIAGSFLTIFPLAFYNRKLGYHAKWFMILYNCFYPLQFAVIIVFRP